MQTENSIAVTEESFQTLVLDASHNKPVIVDYWADWCAPCHALAPVLDRVMAEFADRVSYAKVEVDDNMRLAGRYQLRGFPTVIFYAQGEEQDRFASAKPAEFIREFLARNLAAEAGKATQPAIAVSE